MPESNKKEASSKNSSWFSRFLDFLVKLRERGSQIKNAFLNLLKRSPKKTKEPSETQRSRVEAPSGRVPQENPPEPPKTVPQETKTKQTPEPIPVSLTLQAPAPISENLQNLINNTFIRIRSLLDPLNALRLSEQIYNTDRVRVEYAYDQIIKNLSDIQAIITTHQSLPAELQVRLEKTLQAIIDDKTTLSLNALLKQPSIIIGHMKSLSLLMTSIKHELGIVEKNVTPLKPQPQEIINQAKSLGVSTSSLSDFLTPAERARVSNQIETLQKYSVNTPEYAHHLSQLSEELRQIFAMSESLETALRVLAKTLQRSTDALAHTHQNNPELIEKIKTFENKSTYLETCLTYDLFAISGKQSPINFRFYIISSMADTLSAFLKLKLAISSDLPLKLPDRDIVLSTIKEARSLIKDNLKLLNYTPETTELRLHLMLLNELTPKDHQSILGVPYFAIKEQMAIVQGILAKQPAAITSVSSLPLEEVWTRTKETERQSRIRERRAAEKAAAETQSDPRVKWILDETTELEEDVRIYNDYSQAAPYNLRHANTLISYLQTVFKKVQETAQTQGYNDPDVISFIVSNAVISQLSNMHSKDQLEKFNKALQALETPPPPLITSEEGLIALRDKIGIKLDLSNDKASTVKPTK